MIENPDYELIDFGDGRKLESLSGYVVNRPSPAAIDVEPSSSHHWSDADAYFDEVNHRWSFRSPWPSKLSINGNGFSLPLRATPFGHIGAFPEQREHWAWLATTINALWPPSQTGGSELVSPAIRPKALNLFAHTGGSTFAMAAMGAQVTHVDAAKPNVVAARQAANDCGLANAAIRYIVDDALKFTAREVRRKQTYPIIVLDPPAYGHSPDGKAWRIERDLWPLFDATFSLMPIGPGMILFTGHTDGIVNGTIRDYIRGHQCLRFAKSSMQFEMGRSQLFDRSQRPLDAGYYVRVWWQH